MASNDTFLIASINRVRFSLSARALRLGVLAALSNNACQHLHEPPGANTFAPVNGGRPVNGRGGADAGKDAGRVISDAGRAAQGTTADGSVSIDADGGGGGNPPPDAQGNVAVDLNDGGPHGDLTTSDASATPDADEGGRGQTSTVTRWTCDGDYAYWATSSIVFTAPTPAALAKAFSIVSVDVHPISLVLHLEKSALLGALSATISGSQHADVFSSNEVPSFASAVPAFGAAPGVTTVEPQQSAFLHFEDRTGAIAIQLEHVVWRATEGTSCNDLTVAFQAVLPSSQLAVVLHLPDGDRTIAQVLSAPDAGPTVAIVNPIVDASSPVAPVEIGAVFEAAPTTFDFTTL